MTTLSTPLSIRERMRRVHECIRLERSSGISTTDRAGSTLVVNVQDRYIAEMYDSNAVNWGDFGDWNDSPGFSLRGERGK